MTTFTLLYENVHLTKNREVTENSFGVKLEPPHRERLALLASAFRRCHSSDAAVEFRVTGSASTAEFRLQLGGSAPYSDEELRQREDLRQQTATLRAQIVGNYLTKQGFMVQTNHGVQRPRPDDAQTSVDQPALKRMVFIELVSAGACGFAP